MKIVTVIGARPQFIKASAVSRAIRDHNLANKEKIEEIILHTGQHFDENMSKVFFDDLDIKEPDYNLEISGCSHGAMTGKMLEGIERILLDNKPDMVLIYGDTNSTLAGALAAVKMHIPVAHVEAGLRSFNNRMPEEINRIVSDRISNFLFCPTEAAVNNLVNEGIESGVELVGDVMYDVTLYYREKAKKQHSLDEWGVEEKEFALCTIHRAENTDDMSRLENILAALRKIAAEMTVLLPLHPRTRILLENRNLMDSLGSVRVLDPLAYLEMQRLEMSAKIILTDSGGVQKEAFFHKVPCLTLRDETEWVETLDMRANHLCGADKDTILETWKNISDFEVDWNATPYGDGAASGKIVDILGGLS